MGGPQVATLSPFSAVDPYHWRCHCQGTLRLAVGFTGAIFHRQRVLDFNNHTHSLTWLVLFGDYTKGDFPAPQFGEAIPVLLAGDVFNAVIHVSTSVRSERVSREEYISLV